MIRPFVMSAAVLVALFCVCKAIWLHRHPPAGADPYACFGAGRYDAMRDARVCRGFENW